MQPTITREHVLAMLEKHRATPGAPVDESHFPDFLLADPQDVGVVFNSFAGLRRFNRFIDAIQLEYGICFSQADVRRSFSVDAFIERVRALQASPKGSLASLRNQEQAGAGWRPVVILDFFLTFLAFGLRHWPWAAGVVVMLAMSVTLAFAAFANWHRRRLALLRQRIEAGTPPPKRRVS